MSSLARFLPASTFNQCGRKLARILENIRSGRTVKINDRLNVPRCGRFREGQRKPAPEGKADQRDVLVVGARS